MYPDFTKCKQITKKEGLKILVALQGVTKINPELGGFMIRKTDNNRGDYGYDEYYYYQGELFWMVSRDGARIDPKYYKTNDTNNIILKMRQDASK